MVSQYVIKWEGFASTAERVILGGWQKRKIYVVEDKRIDPAIIYLTK